MATQDAKLAAMEELVMLEEHLSRQLMPQSFKYSNDILRKQESKYDQRIQRAMLASYVEKCETLIRDHEHSYQQEITTLEFDFSVTIDHNTDEETGFMNCVKTYLSQRHHHKEHEISFKVTCFQSRMSRRFRRHYRSASKTTHTNVFPHVIVDVPNVPLNQTELGYLSRGNID